MSNYKRTLGHRKVDRETFDSEIQRLIGLGLNQRDIALRLKTSRWTVSRAVERLEKSKPRGLEEAKTTGAYVRLTFDSFNGLPEILPWIESMKARGVGDWRRIVNVLHRICDDLEIYPSMLDISWAVKYLARVSDSKSKAQLRKPKQSLRSWLKFAFKATDTELQEKGIDARHYEMGKYATVLLTEDQIERAIKILQDGLDTKALLAFRVGSECCTPLQELRDMKRSDYLREEGILRTYRKKTDGYWSKYPSEYTGKLIMTSQTEEIFTNVDLKRIKGVLRDVYKQVGATNVYFTIHPIHSLRHIGAQRLLRKTGYNRPVTAKLGGWEAEKTLEDCYGAVPDVVIRKVGESLWI